MTKSMLILVGALTVAACSTSSATTLNMANDALPSAEVTAFQAADARLRWKNARIKYDARGCAFYQGTAPDGQVRTAPLIDGNNQPICSPR